jgi:hypothetical protein
LTNYTTHNLTLRMGVKNYTTEFRFYNLQDDQLVNLHGTPGRTYLKVINVTVEYKGKVVPYIKVNDLNLVTIAK